MFVQRLGEVELPIRSSNGAGGYDLYIPVSVTVLPVPTDILLVPSRIAVQIPDGMVGKLRARSSLGKRGLLCQGEIDSDYRGEIIIGFWNLSTKPIDLKAGTRVVQMTVVYCLQSQVVEVDKLEDTERGSGGFGSTGV